MEKLGKQKKIIGILGGMGPEATKKLFREIIAATPASKDQDHIQIIVNNNPNIPDRTEAILYGNEDPLPEIIKTAKTLENAGVDFITMPCNTAHHFISEVQKEISVPILNMIEEAVKFVKLNYPDVKMVGLLATTGTIESKIYHDYLKKQGIEVIIPSSEEQEVLVMEAIYGKKGIKAKYKRLPKQLLELASKNLMKRGAEIIIAGCTEIGMVLKQKNLDFVVIDPSKILADVAVEKALAKEVKEVAL